MKQCGVCKQTKALSDFHKHKKSKDGHTSICKPCAIAKTRKWERENKDRRNETARRAYARDIEINREKDRAYREAHREQDRATKKAWYEAHKEEQAARIKAKREANPEAARAAQRERTKRWNENHPGLARQRNRDWRANNRQKSNAYSKKWAVNNKDKVRERQRRWAAENRAKIALYQEDRRARDAGASGRCTPEQLQARLDYYGGRCWVPGCGKPYEAIDHMISLKEGGTNWPGNLRPICKSCNSSKGAKHPLDFLRERAARSTP